MLSQKHYKIILRYGNKSNYLKVSKERENNRAEQVGTTDAHWLWSSLILDFACCFVSLISWFVSNFFLFGCLVIFIMDVFLWKQKFVWSSTWGERYSTEGKNDLEEYLQEDMQQCRPESSHSHTPSSNHSSCHLLFYILSFSSLIF